MYSLIINTRGGSYMKKTAPFGYDFSNGKLIVNNEEADIVKYCFEAEQNYMTDPPVWDNATINDGCVCLDTEMLCSINTFVKGYIAKEINTVRIMGKPVSSLFSDEKVRSLIRQQITDQNISEFCSITKENISQGL